MELKRLNAAVEKKLTKLAAPNETEARIANLEEYVKECKELDPKDTSGKQAQIKEQIEALKKTIK